MARLTTLLLTIALLLAVAASVGARGAAAQAPQAVKIRIPITENGFNDVPSGYVVTVEEGQLVELTFVWSQTLNLADEHLFVIEGYNVETKTINGENREATVSFVADKVGNFRIKCDLDCEIHDKLKNGTLSVVRKGAGGARTAAGGAPAAETRPKTQLSVVAPQEATVGDSAQLMVTATDATGAPIAGAKVRVVEVTAFFGSLPQEVEVATGTADKNGVANLLYAARRSGDRVLKAQFDGDAKHQPASLDLRLPVSEGPSVYRVTPPPGIPGVNRFLVSAVILAVWGTMFIVALHVVAIVRAGRAEQPGGVDEGAGNG